MLKLASEKSKNAGEMVKYEKLKKLQKSYQGKYKDKNFSEKDIQSKLDEHKLKINEMGQRYINKNLQRWSKVNNFFMETYIFFILKHDITKYIEF